MTVVERAFQLQQHIMENIFRDVDVSEEAGELDRLCYIMTEAEQSYFLDLCERAEPKK